jgi:hypothetical protein
MDTMAKKRSRAGRKKARGSRHAWPNVARLADDCHAQVDINGGGCSHDISVIHLEADQVCVFHCGGLSFEAIIDHCEELATRQVDEGIVTDDVNGQEWSVWWHGSVRPAPRPWLPNPCARSCGIRYLAHSDPRSASIGAALGMSGAPGFSPRSRLQRFQRAESARGRCSEVEPVSLPHPSLRLACLPCTKPVRHDEPSEARSAPRGIRIAREGAAHLRGV